jgi:hypothetical protein
MVVSECSLIKGRAAGGLQVRKPAGLFGVKVELLAAVYFLIQRSERWV